MAIKGYLIYNITKENDKIFTSQIAAWINAFKLENVDIKVVNNLLALDTIKSDKDVRFVLFWDKDVALMYELANLGIKLFNNIDAVRLADDKAYTYARLIKYKVNTPRTLVMPLTFIVDLTKYFDAIKSLLKVHGINYPMVVKERRNSLGLGVYLVKSDEELRCVLKEKWSRELIVQEYIGYEPGVDYRVYVINHRPKVVVMRKNTKDFRSNIEQGGVMSVIVNPHKDLLKIALKASLAVQLDFGAIDIVRDANNKYYVLEVNSNARTATIDKIAKTPLTRSVVKYILNNI